MKKFISVLLAILMVVAVMPFAIFAAEEGYVREKNTAHVCHPVDKDGNLILDAVDMADATVAFTKAATDTQVVEKYLTDGKKDTATRLPVGTTAKLTITFAEAKDLGTLTLTVNGKGKINPGEEFEAEVVKDSTHNLAVKVVAYNGTTKVYEDTAAVDTTEIKDLVVNIFEKADKIEITTAGAAKADKGGPRLWEISATTVKGEADYDHDIKTVVVKASTTKTAGKAYDVCGVCGYKSAEYDLPLLTADDLTGGKLTLDDVIITEELTKYDEDGKTILKDDDGNDMLIEKPLLADPNALFDGDLKAGDSWTASGSYWTAAAGGKLIIEFKEARTIAYLNITMVLNSWPGIIFEFYNGETLVGIDGGTWKEEGDPDKDGPEDRWSEGSPWGPTTYNFATEAYADLEGKTIDKIVITITNPGHTNFNAKKIVEIEVGCHIHQYADADVKANGTHGTGKDICKWTHDAKCIECEAVANDAIAYIHDIETTEHRAATCGNGIYTDVCKAEGCGYKNEN
ncbi:MAG: hypothetical protein IKC74_02485, partial [Clostridia bacterium]|nr:hypothetical protein [Clostridia bacterium]